MWNKLQTTKHKAVYASALIVVAKNPLILIPLWGKTRLVLGILKNQPNSLFILGPQLLLSLEEL
jgi:hypothetical protein